VINAVPCDTGRSNISQHYDLLSVSDDIYLASNGKQVKVAMTNLLVRDLTNVSYCRAKPCATFNILQCECRDAVSDRLVPHSKTTEFDLQ
jgi:hypothetical protein